MYSKIQSAAGQCIQYTTLDYSYDVNQYRDGSDMCQHEDSLQLPCYDYMLRNYRHSTTKVCSSTAKSNLTENFHQETMKTILHSTPKSYKGTRYQDFVLYCDNTLIAASDDSYVSSDSDVQCVPECTVLTREADGCEDPATNFSCHTRNSALNIHSTVSSKSNSSRPSKKSSKCSSKPLASSTMIEDMADDEEHYTISTSNRKCTSPCASSTMTEDMDAERKHSVDSASHKKRKSPCASSTMIKEANIVKVPKVCQPNTSIYTWIMDDSSDKAVFQDSYVKGHHLVVEPSTAYIKVLKTVKRKYRHATVSSTRTMDTPQVVPCHLADDLSLIEASGDLCDLDTDSLYDEDIPVTNNLPRTSTRLNLHEEISDFNDLTNNSETSDDLVQDRLEPEMPHPKVVKGFKLTRSQLRKLFSFKRSKGKNSKKNVV